LYNRSKRDKVAPALAPVIGVPQNYRTKVYAAIPAVLADNVSTLELILQMAVRCCITIYLVCQDEVMVLPFAHCDN
jgi:hypothetical protein